MTDTEFPWDSEAQGLCDKAEELLKDVVLAPPKFNPGDVVQLKSGSPRYTVVKQEGENVLLIYSVYEQKDIMRDAVPVVCLTKANAR